MLLNTKPHNRTLQIASMNVDTMRTKESIFSVIDNIFINKIDIACIQETHNINGNETETDNYKIYFAKAIKENDNNKGIGGVAIMIRENLTNEITNIRRTSERNMSIIMKTSNKTNIHILRSYRMSLQSNIAR